MSNKVDIFTLYSIDWLGGVLYVLRETTCLLLPYFFFCTEISIAPLTTCFCSPPSLPSSSLSGFRQRRREVLWESSSPPETCPHLVESIPCEDPTCYLWQVQQEERCTPTKSSCGPGTAVQNVTCVSAEGNVLDLHHKRTACINVKILRVFLGRLPATKAYSKVVFFDILGNMFTDFLAVGVR